MSRDRRHDRAKPLESLVAVEPGTIGFYIKSYLDHLAVRNYSPHYVRSAMISLRFFAVWCEERGLATPAEITLAVIERYQRTLYYHRKANGRGLSFQSQNDRLASVKRFFRWLAKSRVLEASPAEMIDLPRVERRLPKNVLSIDETEKVLARPDVRTPMGLRDRAMLELLYSTGMRRQELYNLRVFDVDIEGQSVIVWQGKGKKDRSASPWAARIKLTALLHLGGSSLSATVS